MNLGLLKSWQNWALVAFVLVVIIVVMHGFMRDTNNVPAFAPN